MLEPKVKLTDQRGVASIPVALSLIMLVIAVGLMIASLSAGERLLAGNLTDSSRAAYYAQSGVRDALERLARNKSYSGSYSIDMAAGGCSAPFAGCATVAVNDGAGTKIASSTGRVGDIYRRVQVEVTLDSNGLITAHSWQEQ